MSYKVFIAVKQDVFSRKVNLSNKMAKIFIGDHLKLKSFMKIIIYTKKK